MLYFKRIKGNVKGGCDVELGPRTLITGTNGAGKSRVVNTLELASSAEASDIVGRPTVRRGLDLLALGPPEDTLEAHAETNTGKTCELMIERAGKGKGKTPKHTALFNVRVEFPIREALEALRGDVRKAQAFVLNHAGLKVSDKVLKKNIATELHGLYDIFAQANDNLGEGIPRLQAIRDAAAKIARDKKAGAKKAETLIEALAAQLPLSEPTDEEVAEAQAATREANAAYTQATQLPETVDPAALKAEAVAAIGRYKATEKKVEAIEAQASRPADPVAQLRLNLIPLLSFYAPRSGGACVLCKSGRVEGTQAELMGRVSDIRQSVQQEQMRAQAAQILGREKALLANQQAAAKRLIVEYQAAENAAVPEVNRQEAIAAAYAKLQACEQVTAQINKNKGSWQTVSDARQRALSEGQEATQAGQLVDVCDNLLRSLTKRSKKAFIANVQQYLPPTDVFDLVLSEGKRNVCQFGFRRGEDLHTALSGAEWARLTIALGAACMSAGDDVLAVLTPEERAFDPGTLQDVMEALVESPGQVILTSPVEPPEIPAGWTHIRVT